MVRAIGGDLVGMSTTLEAIASREAGMEVLGISLVTNLAAGISGEPLNHEEVLEAGKAAATRMGALLGADRPADLHARPPHRCRRLHRTVVVGLADRGHEVVGLDLLPEPEGYDGRWHTADCADADAVRRRLREPSRSMASSTSPACRTRPSLPDALTSHVVTTGALLDAMVAHDVAGSSTRPPTTPSGAPRAPNCSRVDVPPRPDTFYGVAKVAAEALLRLYADRYGIDAVACRIGSFQRAPEHPAAAVHLALPRRLRPDGRRGPHDSRARASPCSTASPPTPAPGGTSSPAAPSATTPRTTPRSSRPRVAGAADDDRRGGATSAARSPAALPAARAGSLARRPPA